MTKEGEEKKKIGLVAWQLTNRESLSDEADSQASCSCFYAMDFLKVYLHLEKMEHR